MINQIKFPSSQNYEFRNALIILLHIPAFHSALIIFHAQC